MKFTLVFLLSALLLFLLLYLYPAHIFEARVSNGITETTAELSLKAIFLKEDLPDTINAAQAEEIRPTKAGYAMMLICLAGLPAMIAWRFTLGKNESPGSQDENGTGT